MRHLRRPSRRHNRPRLTFPDRSRELARAEAYAEVRRRNPDLFR